MKTCANLTISRLMHKISGSRAKNKMRGGCKTKFIHTRTQKEAGFEKIQIQTTGRTKYERKRA